MKSFLFLLIASAFLSCNSEQTKTTIVRSKKTQAIKVVPNQMLVAEVEGMVCKMGCGGAIRKELISTNKVSRVEVNFVEGAKKQTINIHFDKRLISEDQIVQKIESINKGQFKAFAKELRDL